MGGGIGLLSRAYGIGADNILEAQLVIANGSLVSPASKLSMLTISRLFQAVHLSWAFVCATFSYLLLFSSTIEAALASFQTHKAHLARQLSLELADIQKAKLLDEQQLEC